LKRHQRVHSEDQYSCHVCNTSLSCQKDLNKHQCLHIG
jgi:hypothetical protein